MPLVTSLDGKHYSLDAKLLEKYRIPDAATQQLDNMPPLPKAPPLLQPAIITSVLGGFTMRRGRGNLPVFEITPNSEKNP